MLAVVSWGSEITRSLESVPYGLLSGLPVLDELPTGLAALDVRFDNGRLLAREGDGVRDRLPTDPCSPSVLRAGDSRDDEDSSCIGDGKEGAVGFGGDSSVRSNGSGGEDGRGASGRE